MHQPQGFVGSKNPSYVCRLIKFLYYLKQAPWAWHSKFTRVLSILGFVASQSNTSLFEKHDDTNAVILLLYVNDIILIVSYATQVQEVTDSLGELFDLKDIRQLNYFLGLQISIRIMVIYLCINPSISRNHSKRHKWRLANLLLLHQDLILNCLSQKALFL